MNVLKLYMKIFKRGGFAMSMMYLAVFVIITVMFMSSGGSSSQMSFEMYKCRTTVINNDDSELAANLTKYINERTMPIELPSNDELAIKDGLFARNIMIAIIIPEGFGDSFGTENAMKTQVYSVPDSASAVLVEQAANSYLTTADLYYSGTGSMDFAKIEADLDKSVEVAVTEKYDVSTNSASERMITYMAYPILAVMLFASSYVIIIISKTDIKRRMNCAPISPSSANLQLYLGTLLVSLIVYAVMMALMFIMQSEQLTAHTTPLYMLNVFIFLMVSTSISFFLAGFGKMSVITPAANAISLACSFFGGVFVPISMLSDTVLSIAVVNPAFWYAKANLLISKITDASPEIPSDLIMYMFIEVCFAVAFFAMSLVLTRAKRTK